MLTEPAGHPLGRTRRDRDSTGLSGKCRSDLSTLHEGGEAQIENNWHSVCTIFNTVNYISFNCELHLHYVHI